MSDSVGRLIIIGLDGLNWALLDPLLRAGVMPHLARLKATGAWGPLTSVVPTQSATAWASFMTGQNPARHGVLSFMVRRPDGSYHHAKPRRTSTLWYYLGRAGRTVGVLNFPVTYPPDPVNGFQVSGMLAPPGRTFTYPAELARDLLAAVPAYRLDLEWQLYSARERVLLREVTEMTQVRLEAARYLRDTWAPDLFAVAFIGPDRLQHALWRHLDPSHPAHDAGRAAELSELIRAFYSALDAAVGQLVAEGGESATVLVLSDHGFQPAMWQFQVNDWLAEQGWLNTARARSRLERVARRLDTPWVQHIRRCLVKDISRHFRTFAPGGTVDWAHTAAFSPWSVQQGIRLNVLGREPEGIVAPGTEYEQVRDQIARALREANEPKTGRRAVDRIWKREELYSGPLLEEMPDLVFTLRSGFASSPLRPTLWAPTGWGSGDHSLEGILIAWGRGVAPGRLVGAELIDIAPTALHLLGHPVPAGMDGKVLVGALDPGFVAAHPVRHESADQGDAERGGRGRPKVGVHQEESFPELQGEEGLSAEEEADVQARLRGLGYL